MWDWLIAPFADKTWWDILNSSIVATALSSTVGIILAQRVGQVAHESKVATEAKQAAERDESRAESELGPEEDDQAPPPQADQSATTTQQEDPESKARFHRAASAIRVLKDFVDARADRVKDGRVRRKYDNISRRDYRVITSTLGHDGGLPPDQLKELMAAFERWRSFRTGRAFVSERVASEYEALAKKYHVTANRPGGWKPERARTINW